VEQRSAFAEQALGGPGREDGVGAYSNHFEGSHHVGNGTAANEPDSAFRPEKIRRVVFNKVDRFPKCVFASAWNHFLRLQKEAARFSQTERNIPEN
jgi:hypothetical protein